MEQVLYCDFDGTFIEENSEKLLIDYLKEIHFFNCKHYFLAALGIFMNLPRRMIGKENIMKAWTLGMNSQQKEKLLNEFIRDKGRKIHLNIAVVQFVKSFEGKRVLLSGSDVDLLRTYLKSISLIEEFDEIYGCEMAENGIRVLRHPYGKTKVQYVDQNAMTVGIANEIADQYYLKNCKKVYVIKGDSRLERLAYKNKWSLI